MPPRQRSAIVMCFLRRVNYVTRSYKVRRKSGLFRVSGRACKRGHDVPDSEAEAEDTESRSEAKPPLLDERLPEREPESRRERGHRQRGRKREHEQGAERLSAIGNRREQQDAESGRPPDSVDETDAVRPRRRANDMDVSVLVSAGSSVRVQVTVDLAPVNVAMGVEGPPPPLAEHLHRQQDDEDADERLGRAEQRIRQVAAGEDDRYPEHDQRRSVTESPGGAQDAGTTRRPLALRRDEGRNGDEVIRIRRVAKSEQERDREDDDGRAATRVGDELLET
jgi:hypothetical protein